MLRFDSVLTPNSLNFRLVRTATIYDLQRVLAAPPTYLTSPGLVLSSNVTQVRPTVVSEMTFGWVPTVLASCLARRPMRHRLITASCRRNVLPGQTIPRLEQFGRNNQIATLSNSGDR